MFLISAFGSILGDPGAVSRVDKMLENFHHEHFIDPTNCPWVSEDGSAHNLEMSSIYKAKGLQYWSQNFSLRLKSEIF